MPEPTLSCACNGYCDRCDVIVDLPGLRVVAAEREVSGQLTVTVEGGVKPSWQRVTDSGGVVRRIPAG